MTQRWPRQPERRVFRFLTAGTGGGNSAPGVTQKPYAAAGRVPAGSQSLQYRFLQPIVGSAVIWRSFNKGVPRMTNQNQNNPTQKPGQQNQNPGQKPGQQQQGGGQKPGQQQQDPNRMPGQNPGQQGQNPGQRTDR